MPSANTTEDSTPIPDYSHLSLDTEPPPSRLRPAQSTNQAVSIQHPENRSTTSRPPPRRDSQDVKPHNNERESKQSQADRELPESPPPTIITTTTTTTATVTTTATAITKSTSTDCRDSRSGRSSRQETASGSESDCSTESYEKIPPVTSDDPRERERPKEPTSTTGSKLHRVPLNSQSNASYAQAARHSSKDPLQAPPPGAAEGSPPRGSAASRTIGRHPNAQILPGHLSEVEQQEMSEIRQAGQVPGYGQGVMGALLSFMPATSPLPPKDKYQALKDEYHRVKYDLKQAHGEIENYKHELRRTRGELRNASHFANELHHEKQRWKDHMNGLQNELNNVHQQLDDAKTLSEVRGKELFGAQVFLTKADTLSISEVGEKVTALNEEIFQAAATLGETLTHKRHEVPQEDLDVAVVKSREMVGAKILNVLISQAQKPEPEVNPLLVQVVLQIFMVKFCVSKIQSWYPNDSNIEGFLDAIYSEIRLSGRRLYHQAHLIPRHLTFVFSEEQAVSGRWRALTRAHTRPTTETWTNELSHKLMSVLKVPARMPGSSESQESFLHRLPPIFKAVHELRTAIGEKFTSADLEVSVFDCDTPYQPTYMEDAYGDGRNPSGKRGPECVVGTTGIGLKKLMAERAVNDTLQWQNVISAKIVLESTLKEALEPVQTSSRLRRKKKPIENVDSVDKEDRGGSKPKTGLGL